MVAWQNLAVRADFPALATRCMFSRACQPLHDLPRLPRDRELLVTRWKQILMYVYMSLFTAAFAVILC